MPPCLLKPPPQKKVNRRFAFLYFFFGTLSIFNFTDKFPFLTRLNINGTNIDVVEKTKLLGTIVTNDLKLGGKYSVMCQKKAQGRIQQLRKVASFESVWSGDQASQKRNKMT